MKTSMANSSGTLFIISDRTGITLEHLVRTLVTQFDELRRERIVLPFLDTPAKIAAAVREIDAAGQEDGALPVVFSSIVDEASRALLQTANARVYDIFDTFLPSLSDAFGLPYMGHIGRSHGIGDLGRYDRRVAAVNFALNFDDGARLRGLGDADLILIGVSRSGKTPTCLYLALQYGVYAANYPLTDEELETGVLPAFLLEQKGKLFGLTIEPERLRDIRKELFAELQTLSLRYFDRNPHGELMSRLTNDIDAINQAVSQNVTSLFASVLSMVGILIAMFVLNVWLALASVLVARQLRAFGRYTITDFLAFRFPHPIVRVLVPLLKMIALTYLLLSVQRKSPLRKNQRTRLYRVTELVGRWSMVDVFVVTVLVALVHLGQLANVAAGAGAVYFAAVVILTMLAANAFDPRLIWDVVDRKER